MVIDEALDGNVFHFLRTAVVAVSDFHKEVGHKTNLNLSLSLSLSLSLFLSLSLSLSPGISLDLLWIFNNFKINLQKNLFVCERKIMVLILFQEYYLRRVHGLVTDFIFHMPLRVSPQHKSTNVTLSLYRFRLLCTGKYLSPLYFCPNCQWL